ncbi:cation-dependent mannose-6-phosphate receptor-like [Dreissena polymorpha]|uniref:Autophagy-related protein 27 n=1 Tax=Dreissena polymorpha TaxID=45954 RepID=A0A9D4C8L3_DREPO|nr:cation-dependent mannose-6-phosphate receptor-like [Dreissena polymorpha]KAH3719472.1 hypothetical protein DPMN_062309 [Dreissena polymorpha]
MEKTTIVSVVLFMTTVMHGESKQCVQNDECSCTFDDGSGKVDLSMLGSKSTSIIRDIFAPDNYAYSFNPCYPFSEGTCANAAGCQIDTARSIYYNIGDSKKVDFSFDGSNVVGAYTAHDGARKSQVTYICDPSASSPTFTVMGETKQSFYEFRISSKYACPDGGSGPGPGPGPIITVSVSISVGWVLTILFLSGTSLYLIAGLLVNKIYRHNSGRELLPNISFWISFPGLVKDGCLFVVGLVRGRGGYGKV